MDWEDWEDWFDSTPLLLAALVAAAAVFFAAGWYAGSGKLNLKKAPIRVKKAEKKPVAKPAAVYVPPQPKPQPLPAPPTLAAALYTIQLGAFNDPKQAKELQTELREKGHATFVFEWTDANFRRWFAVRTGDYPDLDAAAKAAKEFRVKDQMLALVRPNGAP